MKSILIVLTLAITSCSANAGQWSPDDDIMPNLGSGYAAATLCALNGYADPKRVAELGILYSEVLTEEAMIKFKHEYQKALHEKRIYSIYKKKWYEIKVSETACSTIDNAVEMVIEILRNKK